MRIFAQIPNKPMKQSDFCVFLDAGHGGISPLSGGYISLTNGKKFTHKEGTFHDGTTFYEGVFNRQLAAKLEKELLDIGIRVVHVYHEYMDTSLENRVLLANKYNHVVKQGIFVSIHANASLDGTARGFSVFTTKEKSKGDIIADFIWEQVKLDMPEFKMREDRSDGDHDYEAQFYVLRKTDMPAVLIETLFFDNYEDAKMLMDGNIQQRVAASIAKALQRFIYNNIT